jgi:abequosyltransferase
MSKICFAIPTWNRANKLKEAVESIAHQIIETQLDVSIFISDNFSDDETPTVITELIAKYSFVTFMRRQSHGGVFDNLSDVTEHAKGNYIWWFGDDDKLLPGGLQLVSMHLNDPTIAFVSAGNGSFKPHSGKVVSGTLLGLCNQLGWNQVIGWMSADILRSDVASKVYHLMRQEPYKLDAYAHVGSLLTAACNLKAIHIDQPIAEPQGKQEKLDVERWNKENIGWRYFLLIDTFKYMFDQKIFTQKFNPDFFKYLSYYLWDRFITNMVSSSANNGTFPERGWEIINLIAEMVDEPNTRKNIRIRSSSAQQLCIDRKLLINQIKQNEQRMLALLNETNHPTMPLGYLNKTR